MSDNLWVNFIKTVDKTDFRIVDVITVSPAGQPEASKVRDLAGGLEWYVIGTSVSAGNRAYVKDGIIIGEAPNAASVIDMGDYTV